MNQRDFNKIFLQELTDVSDLGAIRQRFVATLDAYHREGRITEKQAHNWELPDKALTLHAEYKDLLRQQRLADE